MDKHGDKCRDGDDSLLLTKLKWKYNERRCGSLTHHVIPMNSFIPCGLTFRVCGIYTDIPSISQLEEASAVIKLGMQLSSAMRFISQFVKFLGMSSDLKHANFGETVNKFTDHASADFSTMLPNR